jgi:hypothetical protein
MSDPVNPSRLVMFVRAPYRLSFEALEALGIAFRCSLRIRWCQKALLPSSLFSPRGPALMLSPMPAALRGRRRERAGAVEREYANMQSTSSRIICSNTKSLVIFFALGTSDRLGGFRAVRAFGQRKKTPRISRGQAQKTSQWRAGGEYGQDGKVFQGGV